MSPKRIQLSRRAGYRKPEGAVVVSRPGRFGNPYTVQNLGTAKAAVEAFRCYLLARRNMSPRSMDFVGYPSDDEIREALAGRDLACWCAIDSPCHGDVLLRIAAGGEP